MKEIETKIPNINVEEIISKLEEIGAKKESEKFYRIISAKLNNISSKIKKDIRLRTDGQKTTLCYKMKTGIVGETEEIEFEVSDFELAKEFLNKFDFTYKCYQEKKRILYTLDDIEFVIDFWPYIDPLLEIEADSKIKINKALELLNLKGKDRGEINISDLFKEKGLDMFSFREIKF